jgi:hypothetical protein
MPMQGHERHILEFSYSSIIRVQEIRDFGVLLGRLVACLDRTRCMTRKPNQLSNRTFCRWVNGIHL